MLSQVVDVSVEPANGTLVLSLATEAEEIADVADKDFPELFLAIRGAYRKLTRREAVVWWELTQCTLFFAGRTPTCREMEVLIARIPHDTVGGHGHGATPQEAFAKAVINALNKRTFPRATRL